MSPTEASGGWLSRERVTAWSLVFLAVETALFVLLVMQQRGIVFSVGPASIDFVSFYAAGKLVLQGTAPLAYDQAAHGLAEQQATAPGVPYVFFFYPPVFLLLCAALARLPYLVAYAVFQGFTFTLFAWTLRRIAGIAGWRWWLPVLACPALFWNLGQGQNAFLTCALLGAFTLQLDRRPALAGVLLGALCFKPHLGLLAPVALVAGRRWTAFAAATATVAALVALSVALLGWETWRAYFAAMAGAEDVYAMGRINFAGFASPFGALRLAGIAPPVAYALQAAITLVMVALVAVVWRRGGGPAASGVLIAATLLAVPLVLLYDQLFAVVAIAWLLRDTAGGTLRTWERLVLVGCYPVTLVAPIVALGAHVPLAVVASLAVMGVCLNRALRRAREAVLF
jgi:multidrug transporter EmrE-like cation transporter